MTYVVFPFLRFDEFVKFDELYEKHQVIGWVKAITNTYLRMHW